MKTNGWKTGGTRAAGTLCGGAVSLDGPIRLSPWWFLYSTMGRREKKEVWGGKDAKTETKGKGTD